MRWPELTWKGEGSGRTPPHTHTCGVLLALPVLPAPLRYGRSELVVFPTERRQRPTSAKWLQRQRHSSRSLETAAQILRSPAQRKVAWLALLWRSKLPPTRHLPGQSCGPSASPASDLLSPEETPSVFRPQHSFASLVHTDDVGAGGGPCHRIDGRASKGEVGTSVRP